MNTFTCPVCGGKLNIKIGADFAVCSACGKPADLDPADAAKFKEIYGRAGRAMMKKTDAGYREAIRVLDAISFIDEASELSAECSRRLREREADRKKREEFEKASDKRSTVLGIVLAVIALLVVAAVIAGIVYLIVRLASGTLPSYAIWIAVGAAAVALILFVLGKIRK